MPHRAFAVACIVLGAGAGKRFGEPKAGAEVRPGVRFIDAVVSAAAEAGAAPVVAVVQPGFQPPAPARCVENPRSDSEQIVSLRLGLAALANTSVHGTLVWPVDHPFVQADTAREIIAAAEKSGTEIVLPAHGGRRGHPVYFARSIWGKLMGEVRNAREVIHEPGRRLLEVAVGDPGVLRNVDTRANLD